MEKPKGERRIELAGPNPNWKAAFEAEARKLKPVFSDSIGLHHVGSTAIEGIKAKPVIDILGVVKDIAVVSNYREEMEELGYEYKGENGLAGRRYFEKGQIQHTHHLHVFEAGNTEVERHLLFRDYLRAHREEAQAYSKLKQRLAQEYRSDPAGYTEAKSDFIASIDEKAKLWRAREE